MHICSNHNRTGKVDDHAQTDSIAVTFHVLFPYQMWGWNERTRLVMVFGEQNLGNCRAHFCDFTTRYIYSCMRHMRWYWPFHSDVDDGLWEMTTTVNIQADLLKDVRSLPYKYAVLNKNNNIASFEILLYDAPYIGCVVNRCLIIPNASFKIRSKYRPFHCTLCR